MKHFLVLFFLLLCIFGSSFYAETVSNESPSSDDMTLSLPQDSIWTEQMLLSAFGKYAQKDAVIIDCVLATDSAYDIVGIVMYTTGESNSCNFDFLDRFGIPQKATVNAAPSENHALEYVGEDTITCQLLHSDGSSFSCSLTYYETTTEIGFKLVG